MMRKILSWMKACENVWRVALLVLLLIAITGPWSYMSDGTPPAESCRDPNILLRNGRCVRLVSGAEILSFITRGFAGMTVGLGIGATVREFLTALFFMTLLYLLLQPFLSTLLLFLDGDRRSRRVFHVGAWALGVLCSTLVLVTAFPGAAPYTALWGLWLYITVAACALFIELFFLTRDGHAA